MAWRFIPRPDGMRRVFFVSWNHHNKGGETATDERKYDAQHFEHDSRTRQHDERRAGDDDELGGHALTDERRRGRTRQQLGCRSNSGGNPNNNQPSGKTAHGKAMKLGIQMIVRNASRDAHAAHLHARVADEMEDQHSNEP